MWRFIPQIKRSKVVPFNKFGLENSVFKLCSVLFLRLNEVRSFLSMNLVLKILYLNCVVFYTVFLLLPVSANYRPVRLH